MRARRIILRTLLVAAAGLALAGCPKSSSRTGRNFPVVVIETTEGRIKAELWPDKSPVTVENFLRYVDEGHYDGTIFHRVVAGFMIQGGGFTAELIEKGTRGPIRNEADNGVRNLKGTLAMARTGKVHSATSQFFINTYDNRILDHNVRDFGYAVFGQVIEGMDVVQRIERMDTKTVGPHENVPVVPVIIRSIRRAPGS